MAMANTPSLNASSRPVSTAATVRPVPPLRHAGLRAGGFWEVWKLSSLSEGFLPDFRLRPTLWVLRRRYFPAPQINDEMFHYLAGTRLADPAKGAGCRRTG